LSPSSTVTSLIEGAPLRSFSVRHRTSCLRASDGEVHGPSPRADGPRVNTPFLLPPTRTSVDSRSSSLCSA
jgi:hypothetical protein